MTEVTKAPPAGRSGEVQRSAMDPLGVGLVLATCLMVGLHQVAIKVSIEGLSPLFAAGMRSVVAACLILIWCQFRGIRLFERDGTFWAGVVVGVLFALDFAAMYIGLDNTTASRGVIFLYTMPIFVALGAHFLNAGERMTRGKWLGIGVAFLGLVIAFYDGLAADAPGMLLGDVLCLLAGLFWAMTTIVIRKTSLQHISAEKLLFCQLWVSALVLLPMSLAAGEQGIISLTAIVVATFLYQAVVIAFVVYLIWYWLLRLYPPAQLSTYTLLTPLLGVLAGVLLLGEPLSATFVVGALFVVAGLVIVTRVGRAEAGAVS